MQAGGLPQPTPLLKICILGFRPDSSLMHVKATRRDGPDAGVGALENR
jgi:hypothetical protein